MLVRACVRRYGFDYELPDRTAEPVLENHVIGVVDKDSAARYGYRPAGYLDHANRVKEATSEQPVWAPEMMSVLTGDGRSEVNGVGVQEGGCEAEAGHTGYEMDGKPGDENFVLRLAAKAGDAATQREIDTATADVACRTKHTVNGTWVAVQSAYQKRIMAANAEDLRNHQAVSAERLQKATNVLSPQ